MNPLDLARAVDELATANPEVLGYGYADSQHPWHHDPAFDLGRATFLQFLALVRATCGASGTVVQIGLGSRLGRHLALRLCASRVVTVDPDPVRIDALRAATAAGFAADVMLCGDPADPGVVEQVQRVGADCDVLLLDAGATYEDVRVDWVRHAALVRDGGLVAIVDRSQSFPSDRRTFDVDRFVADLEHDFLLPRGVRTKRLGNAHAIHYYMQTARTRSDVGPPPWPAEFTTTQRPMLLGHVRGHSLHGWHGGVFAVAGEATTFCPRRLERNGYPVVLKGESRAQCEQLVTVWCDAEPALARARAHLRAGEANAAQQIACTISRCNPWLRQALIGCLEAAPWNRALLIAQGTLELFGGQPRQGVLLLRRALSLEMVDAELMQTVAAAYLRVLQDEAGARTLLTEGQQRVRARRVAQVCQTQLRGHALWHYPQLLASVRGVIHVGAHRGEDVAVWSQLEIPDQLYIEANPAVFVDLDATCRQARYGRPVALQCAVGAAAGTARLCHGSHTPRASLLAAHPLASPGRTEQPTHAIDVAMHTLDELVSAGQIDRAAHDLLFVDTEGTELEVLRGAIELLRHIDVVCTAVFLEPVYDGAPMPQEIQTFLREVNGGDGFGLRAFEPGDDPARGTAVFRRLKRRGNTA